MNLALTTKQNLNEAEQLRAENKRLRAALVRIADGCGNSLFVAHEILGNNPITPVVDKAAWNDQDG